MPKEQMKSIIVIQFDIAIPQKENQSALLLSSKKKIGIVACSQLDRVAYNGAG